MTLMLPELENHWPGTGFLTLVLPMFQAGWFTLLGAVLCTVGG